MNSNDEQPKLNISPDAPPVNVPTFGCVVYVSPHDQGVQARCANLADLSFVGATERDALSQMVPAFKKRIADCMQRGEDIAWIDPPATIDSNEQKRFIPVHL
ncbi:MAG: hypothetical protein HKN47_06065 [Pirellulaceae bacterium]|nr:hypothetical protein [Pirellulaceae bacterium]